MGFLDSILGGKKKLKGPAPDRLFAMSTAYVTLSTGHGITSKGVAAIVFQALATSDFETIVSEMEELLQGTGADTGTTIQTSEDAHGHPGSSCATTTSRISSWASTRSATD